MVSSKLITFNGFKITYYIGGDFIGTDFNGIICINNAVRRLATWNGSSWGYIGSGPSQNGTNAAIHALYYDVSLTRLYVGNSKVHPHKVTTLKWI